MKLSRLLNQIGLILVVFSFISETQASDQLNSHDTLQNTPLHISTANLALSVAGLTLHGVASGQARVITITNSGNATVNGLKINYPNWPKGTWASSTCTSSLAAGESCTIKVTPGHKASSGLNHLACTTGIAPVPGVVSVIANHVKQVSTKVVVLGYGCIYQGGYIYALTETENTSQSIGGTVMSLTDQAPRYPNGIIWSSNGNGSSTHDVSYDIIPLISEVQTPEDSYDKARTIFNNTYSNTSIYPFPPSAAFATCNGSIDGACNSSNILALYNTYKTNYGKGSKNSYALQTGPTPTAYYAEGLCSNYTIDSSGNSPCSTSEACYNKWYFPAICEIDAIDGGINCPSGTQSIVGNLPMLIGNPSAPNPSTSCTKGVNCLVGYYWSSTVYSGDPHNDAWVEYFSSTGSFQSSSLHMDNQYGVRCSRALTP